MARQKPGAALREARVFPDTSQALFSGHGEQVPSWSAKKPGSHKQSWSDDALALLFELPRQLSQAKAPLVAEYLLAGQIVHFPEPAAA